MNSSKLAQAVIAGGCFWCLDAPFRQINGVHDVVSGYMGGDVDNPSYQQICSGLTGHAEVVVITYDAEIVSYLQILEVFFLLHNPTQLNQQGYDKGTQYRSAIFYANNEEKQLAEQAIKNAQQYFTDKIVTSLEAVQRFYLADEHHQNYYQKNPYQPYCQIIIEPKLQALREKYVALLKY
ncbi:peptide-methionine (S)-S-oxide reductase MsrA [Thalassotalea crassostreae]|uniref:peptide-methionine (S)-S-oxide reductase MsrA n=1 Tax=Thalassotalea crassostreae TaxID=1763536 RepID=UPI000837DD13|nr:peptide-methionine (S)-S-oxide reductase MsrA [Thalassotalea crassostreae]